MEHFDRFSTDLKNMDLAYSKYSHFRMPLSDYEVSEEECMEYFRKLQNAQQMNKERNKNRKELLRTHLLGICVILASLPIYFIYILSDLPFIVLWIIGAGTWGILLYVFNKVDEIIQSSNVIYVDLFSPINDKVEHLFNDYLKEENCRINLFKHHENKN